jgi:hypothetical protein
MHGAVSAVPTRSAAGAVTPRRVGTAERKPCHCPDVSAALAHPTATYVDFWL